MLRDAADNPLGLILPSFASWGAEQGADLILYSWHRSTPLIFKNSFQAPTCPTGITEEEMLPQKNATHFLEANPRFPASCPSSSEMQILLPHSKKSPFENFHLDCGQLVFIGLAPGSGETAPA